MTVVITKIDTSKESTNLDLFDYSNTKCYNKLINSKIHSAAFYDNMQMNRTIISHIRQINKSFSINSNGLHNVCDNDIGINLCDCSHYERVIVDEKIYSDVDSVYNEIFGTLSNFLYIIAKRKNMKNLQLSSRTIDTDGSEIQHMLHDYPNAFLGKTAKNSIKIVYEVILFKSYGKTNKPKEHYSVLYSNKTHGVPFSTTFVIYMKLCLLRIDDDNSKLKVSWKIDFIREIWPLTRCTVISHTFNIAQDIMQEYRN
ncbi:hypothetical protein HZS_1545 [Henneguya salminicola]|nr:hypothetical protein HZS_1545 [Henneguya salminicola]